MKRIQVVGAVIQKRIFRNRLNRDRLNRGGI